MAVGMSNDQIAGEMVVTEKAAAKHINSIVAKLGLPEMTASSRRVRAVPAYLQRWDDPAPRGRRA